MLTKGRLMENIRSKLRTLTYHVKAENRLGMTNINHAAESFYGGLLSIILDCQYPGIKLINLNELRMNFPAIDLADVAQGVCVQVTSTEGRDKVQSTLDKFFAHELDTKYGFRRLIVMIIGEKTEYRTAFNSGTLTFTPENDVWDTEYLLTQIGSLDTSIVKEVDSYLCREMTLPDAKGRLFNQKLSSAMSAGSFIGREKELEQIEAEIKNGTNPIFLSGLGGMGKTELAVKFGKSYEAQGRGNVYFVRFSNSFSATVTTMFNDICDKSEVGQAELSEAEQCEKVMCLLNKCGENDILIIDNVDADHVKLGDLMEDVSYKGLKDKKFRMILTTRFSNDRAVDVDRLSNENLHKIFEKHGASLNEFQMDELIAAVNGHTLTIDLIARILNGKGWRRVTAEMLLNDLKTKALPSAKYREIGCDYDLSKGQAQIYQHLSVVFTAAAVPEDGKNVLRCAILLPPDGMDSEIFGTSLTEKQQEALDTLIDHGWLSAENGLLTIHPVIRIVCQEKLSPCLENCDDFLKKLMQQYRQNNQKPSVGVQVAHVLLNAKDLPATKGDMEKKHVSTGMCIENQWNTSIKKPIERSVGPLIKNPTPIPRKKPVGDELDVHNPDNLTGHLTIDGGGNAGSRSLDAEISKIVDDVMEGIDDCIQKGKYREALSHSKDLLKLYFKIYSQDNIEVKKLLAMIERLEELQ